MCVFQISWYSLRGLRPLGCSLYFLTLCPWKTLGSSLSASSLADIYILDTPEDEGAWASRPPVCMAPSHAPEAPSTACQASWRSPRCGYQAAPRLFSSSRNVKTPWRHSWASWSCLCHDSSEIKQTINISIMLGWGCCHYRKAGKLIQLQLYFRVN